MLCYLSVHAINHHCNCGCKDTKRALKNQVQGRRCDAMKKNHVIAATPNQRIPSFACDPKVDAKGTGSSSSTNKFVPPEVQKRLKHLVAPHVDSFNYFLGNGKEQAIEDILPVDVQLEDASGGGDGNSSDGGGNDGAGPGNLGPVIQIKVHSLQIGKPSKSDDLTNGILTPRECRERGMSYSASIAIGFTVEIDDGRVFQVTSKAGELPVMVMSNHCHLRSYSPQKLLDNREEASEVGGYFIMNGIERVIRLLQVPRRNYAMAIERSSFKNRGSAYSDKGVSMRCVRPDQSSVTVTLHYLNSGGSTLKFVVKKQEFLVPVVIVAKALKVISDKELYDRILKGDVKNTYLSTRLELLLRDVKQYGLSTREDYLAYLGSKFRLFLPITGKTSDVDAGKMLIDKFLFVHTNDKSAKLDCLIHMLRKLYAFSQGKCVADNADALMNHELLLPGHLINMYLKEKIEETIYQVSLAIRRDYRNDKHKCLADMNTVKYYQKQAERFGATIGNRIGTFLSTGNIVSSTGLDLMQVSGYTIVAERLNIYRYMSHFQSVHRGQFFTTMKTTTVRKLLPESWGFLCPVHTPDGSPCGLLNHLSRDVAVIAYPTTQLLPTTNQGVLKETNVYSKWAEVHGNSTESLRFLLASLGMTPAGVGGGDGQVIMGPNSISIMVDGIVYGGIEESNAEELVRQLRLLKVIQTDTGGVKVDLTSEVAFLRSNPHRSGVYPGIYIFTQPGRLIRPVLNLGSKSVEWIGTMEQVFMDIACVDTDIDENITTHLELDPSTMLSQIAALTPYSDYNQSPRNMYQCQMGKQTMGTPSHAIKHRGSDNKLYRIQNSQAPIVQNRAHREYMMDEYPQGTNVLVAVISYTGYDMEDAMIINKATYERGFGHGSVYKTFIVDLEEEEKRTSPSGVKPSLQFCNLKSPPHGTQGENDMAGEKYYDELDSDGLPEEGIEVSTGKPLCCMVDLITGEHRVIKHKDGENAFVDTVRVLGSPGGKKPSLRKVSITLRYRRNPIIGDKFSSRHGQKGTLSVLWPQESMPFTESGMTPDVLINPHAFPSRMTIGMLIESMAGKAGALHGKFQDSSPFKFHEEQRAIDFVGEQLRQAGYHYYGSEPMYSGVHGTLMHADIFIGLVYYQRLRHMVSDKSQVRSTGAVMPLTRQPVKGRKKHGGIRLGEMERDALLAHGVSFCVHDRLMNCSDKHVGYVCGNCGSMLTVSATTRKADILAGAYMAGQSGGPRSSGRQVCKTCRALPGKAGKDVRPVYLPYVYRYLTNELAAMGIKLSLKLSG